MYKWFSGQGQWFLARNRSSSGAGVLQGQEFFRGRSSVRGRSSIRGRSSVKSEWFVTVHGEDGTVELIEGLARLGEAWQGCRCSAIAGPACD